MEPIWYKPQIGPRLKPLIVQVFKRWSGLTGDALINHLHSIRDQAWTVAPYPCVGEWMFLLPSISAFPNFDEILRVAHEDATILDLGCCFGQDLRVLAADQVPTHRMYAMDIKRELWDLGLELFRDREKMHATFIQADIFDQQSDLQKLDGRVDIILACQFLHLFDWEKQLGAMKRIVKLSRPGSMVIGYQRAQVIAQECARPWGIMYLHDVEPFRKIWIQVSNETGTEWKLNVSLVPLQDWGMEEEDIEWMPPDRRGINFMAVRQQAK